MDVRLPDGTIIRGVPDGMTKAELTAKLKANGFNLDEASPAPAAGPQETPQEPSEAPVAPKPRAPALSAVERFVQGLRDPFDGAEQLAVRANRWLTEKGMPGARPLPADAGKAAAERQARAEAGKPEGFDWARLVGNIVSPPNLALMAVPGGGAVKAAALGAGSGALTPVQDEENFWGQKAVQTGAGAAAGSAGNAVLRGFSRVLSPNASRNPDLALLRAEGVRPTVGQAAGGTLGRMEEKAMSLPIMGDAIRVARGRAREDFDRAALNRAARPVGARVTQAGRDGVVQADDAVDAAYDQARSMGPVRLDRQGIRDLRSLMQRAQTPGRLGPNEQNAFHELLSRIGHDVTPGGRIADFKDVDSLLGGEAATFRASNDPFHRRLGSTIRDAQRVLRDSVGRTNPQAAARFREADEGHRNLKVVKDAVNAAGRTDGAFAPGHLVSAVKKADKSRGKTANARGEAVLQDLARAGQNVLGDHVPDSGTAGRLTLGGIGLGAGFLDPSIPTALVGGAAAYMQLPQRVLVAMVASRGPHAHHAAEALRRLGANVGVPAGAAAGGFFDEE